MIDFSKAIELDARYRDAYLNRAMCYEHQKNFEKSSADYSKLIELSFDITEDFKNKGVYDKYNDYYLDRIFGSDLIKKDKENKDILISYNEKIEGNANNEDAYYERANYYKEHNKYDLAILDFSKIIELNTNFIRAYYDRASCYLNLKNYDLSLIDFLKVIELKPDSSGSYYGGSFCYKNKDDYKSAIVFCQNLLN